MTKIVSFLLLLSLTCSLSANSLPFIIEDMGGWTIEMEMEEEKSETKIELDDDLDEYWTNELSYKLRNDHLLNERAFKIQEWTEIKEKLNSPPPEL